MYVFLVKYFDIGDSDRGAAQMIVLWCKKSSRLIYHRRRERKKMLRQAKRDLFELLSRSASGSYNITLVYIFEMYVDACMFKLDVLIAAFIPFNPCDDRRGQQLLFARRGS